MRLMRKRTRTRLEYIGTSPSSSSRVVVVVVGSLEGICGSRELDASVGGLGGAAMAKGKRPAGGRGGPPSRGSGASDRREDPLPPCEWR